MPFALPLAALQAENKKWNAELPEARTSKTSVAWSSPDGAQTVSFAEIEGFV